MIDDRWHCSNWPVSAGRRGSIDRSVSVRKDNLFAREFAFYSRLCSVGAFEQDTSNWSTGDQWCSRRWDFDGSREESSDRFDCWTGEARARVNKWSNGIQWSNSFLSELNLTTNVPSIVLMFVSLERWNTIDAWSEETDEPSSRIHSDETNDLLQVEQNADSSEPTRLTNDWQSWRLESTVNKQRCSSDECVMFSSYRLDYIPTGLEGNDDESVQL